MDPYLAIRAVRTILHQVIACSLPIVSLSSLREDFEGFLKEVNSLRGRQSSPGLEQAIRSSANLREAGKKLNLNVSTVSRRINKEELIMSQSKTIITVAATGAWPKKENNPSVPMTPAEIAEDIYDRWKAGAAIAHLHMREDNVMYAKGQLADSSAQFVRRAVRVIEEFGKKAAAPDEAREILGLKQ